MNHVQLHDRVSDILDKLIAGEVKPQLAREYFNGAGKLIANCKNELIAVNMGAKLDIPLLDITANDSGQLIPLKDVKGKSLIK